MDVRKYRNGPLRAANFGVEGATTKSVLWRLEHGELEGYQPKVIVLTSLGIADSANHGTGMAEILAGNDAIVSQIRARQPHPRILLVTVPRGYPESADELVRTIDTDFAKLADNKTVFYVNM